MIKKIVLVLSSLLLCSTTIAQITAQRKQLALADSLGQIHHFQKAHALADHLLESVNDDGMESQFFYWKCNK